MRVALGFPLADKQTGVYIREGFEELGHCIVAVNDPRVQPGPKQILRDVDEYKPDFVFLAKDPRYNIVIEELSKKVLTVMWNVDVRYDIDVFLNSCRPLYEYVHLKFEIGKGNLSLYRDAGIENVYWLSEGISPTCHHPLGKFTYKDCLAYKVDVAFAGSRNSLHDGRIELLEALEKENSFEFQIFDGVFNLEHSKLCKLAKVNLGHSGWPEVELSMSARDYRVMGAQGFLLTNHVKGIEEWFEVGKMCATYKSLEECIEKIRYYLAHPGERDAIAAHGMKVVHEKHKFSDRLKKVIEKVKEF